MPKRVHWPSKGWACFYILSVGLTMWLALPKAMLTNRTQQRLGKCSYVGSWLLAVLVNLRSLCEPRELLIEATKFWGGLSGCSNSLTWLFSNIVYKTVISMFNSRSGWNDAVLIQSCPVILHLKTEISILNISGKVLNASPFCVQCVDLPKLASKICTFLLPLPRNGSFTLGSSTPVALK